MSNEKQRLHRGVSAAIISTALLTLPLAASAQQQQPQQPQQPEQQIYGPATAGPSITLPSFVQLVKQHGNAVVNISVRQQAQKQSASVPFAEGDPFYEFFRKFMPPPGQEGGQVLQGVGSGFIISQDGYILTNAHVVPKDAEVMVKLTDKREFKAKVLGTDEFTDVALLKIEANQLPVVKIGNPENLMQGEWVAAIGAPFGFENSVTSGIVSAKGRFFPGESYVPFIQSDVAVNPGNSGGPLFNMQGEVVGINSMIYSRTGGYMGLAFAIPIDIAMKIAQELRDTGKVTRSRIGVQVQELTRDLAASFGLSEPRGALVSMVEPSGPAQKAGLQAGDIVLSMNGQPVENGSDLARMVTNNKPDSTLNLEVWRKGRKVPIQVTTAALEAKTAQASEAATAKPAGKAGLVVSDIPAEQRNALKLDHGVLVHRTEGPAARAGVTAGDIILRVNDTQVKGPAHLQTLIEQNEGKTVALLVRRGGDTLFVPLKLPAGEANTK